MRIQPSEWIWKDIGSGADEDVSFWKVPNLPGRYYRLGDTACGQSNSLSTPCESVLIVEDNGDDLVQVPTGSKRIWTDAGSGANYDVSIWKLMPPNGFKCLGMAAVRRHGPSPDLRDYRCVKQGSKTQFISNIAQNTRSYSNLIV